MNDNLNHDELDLFSTTGPVDTVTSTQLNESGPRRSLRPRQSYPVTAPTQMTRKRALSMSVSRNVAQERVPKRAKVDEKKAVSIAIPPANTLHG